MPLRRVGPVLEAAAAWPRCAATHVRSSKPHVPIVVRSMERLPHERAPTQSVHALVQHSMEASQYRRIVGTTCRRRAETRLPCQPRLRSSTPGQSPFRTAIVLLDATEAVALAGAALSAA